MADRVQKLNQDLARGGAEGDDIVLIAVGVHADLQLAVAAGHTDLVSTMLLCSTPRSRLDETRAARAPVLTWQPPADDRLVAE
jgi:hypothetical protein